MPADTVARLKQQVKQHFFGLGGQKHNTVTHGESGITYLVVPGALSWEDAAILWDELGGDPDAHGCSHNHDCCGCVFAARLNVRTDGRRTLLTQYWGINV